MKLTKTVFGIAAVAATLQTQATIIVSLEPSVQSVSEGAPVTMDVVISGLGNHSAPSLAGYLFELNYDSAVLSPTSVTFGELLRQNGFGSLRSFNLNTPGNIEVTELSLQSQSVLEGNQPSSFTVATLGFTALSPGAGNVTFSLINPSSITDASGTSLSFDTSGGLVQVTSATSVADWGSSTWLLSIGLAALVAWRKTGLCDKVSSDLRFAA